VPAPKDLLECIQLRSDDGLAGVGERVADLPAPDLADLVNQLSRAEAAMVIMMLSVPRAIELCDQPTLRRRGAILEQLEPDRAAEILDGLSADERTDIIQQMSQHARRRVLLKLRPIVRVEVEHLLEYPAHTAGGIMTTEFVRLDPTMTVGDVGWMVERLLTSGKFWPYAPTIAEVTTATMITQSAMAKSSTLATMRRRGRCRPFTGFASYPPPAS